MFVLNSVREREKHAASAQRGEANEPRKRNYINDDLSTPSASTQTLSESACIAHCVLGSIHMLKKEEGKRREKKNHIWLMYSN